MATSGGLCFKFDNLTERWKEYIFLHGAKRVSWEGIQTKTNFYFRERTFTFRGRREEGQDV